MSDADSEWIAELGLIWDEYLTNAAVTCLVLYEHIITLDEEVALIWRRKITATSVLLLSTRWTLVLLALADYWLPPTSSDRLCTIAAAIADSLQSIAATQIALFSALRVSALWHDWRFRHVLSGLVFTLAFTPVLTSIALFVATQTTYAGKILGQNTCNVDLSMSAQVYTSLALYSRCSTLVSDVLVLVATWMKTFRQWRESRRLKLSLSVSTLLIRDGTLYYLALLAITIAKLVTSYNQQATWVVLPFLSFMPNILISRFMLNLRQLNEPRASSTDSDLQRFSRFSVPNFRVPSDRLGNIGEPLDFGESVQFAEDEEGEGSSGTDVETAATPHEIGEQGEGPAETRWDAIEEVSCKVAAV